MKPIHWTHYWSEWRGRYRFVYARIMCSGMMHFCGDGLKTTQKKKRATCKNCKQRKPTKGEEG